MVRSLLAMASLAMLVGAGIASAHPQLDHAVPPVGSTVAASPPEIRIFFTQALDPARSGVDLATENGAPIATGKSVVDGQQIDLKLPALAPGTYRVNWH